MFRFLGPFIFQFLVKPKNANFFVRKWDFFNFGWWCWCPIVGFDSPFPRNVYFMKSHKNWGTDSPSKKGGHFFPGKMNLLFLAYSERTFWDLKAGFLFESPIFIFHWGMRFQIWGPETPQISNFIRNKKIWCQIVDNEANFAQGQFELLKSHEN